jgi:hypothetical protein
MAEAVRFRCALVMPAHNFIRETLRRDSFGSTALRLFLKIAALGSLLRDAVEVVNKLAA